MVPYPVGAGTRRNCVRSGPLRAAGVAMLLASCSPQIATHGNTVEPDMVPRIVPGVTSQPEVEAILGSPSSISVLDGETWIYVGSRTQTIAFLEPNVLERNVVTVRFDETGIVRAVDAFGTERGREIEVVERETPTRGNDLSFLQQFLGNIGRFEDRAGGGQ